MWFGKCNIIFIYIWCIYCVAATEKDIWDYDYKGYAFNQPAVGDPPANAPIIWFYKPNSTGAELKVKLVNRTDDFNFTVFLIPSVNNLNDCPTPLNETQNLRQYKHTCLVYKDGDEDKPLSFRHAATGCYYFIMTNARGNNWEWGPVQRNTRYDYFDTKMKLKKSTFQNVDANSTRRLSAELIIPLSCIKVNTELYQIDGDVDAMADIATSQISRTHTCWIEKKDSIVQFNCEVSDLIKGPKFEAHGTEVNGKEWTMVATWTQLRAAGGTYYLQFTPYTDGCEERYGYDTINTWRPVPRNYLTRLAYYDPIPTPPTPEPDSIYHILSIILLACILLGFTAIALMVYRRNKNLEAEPNQSSNEESVSECQTSILLPDEKESNHILLIYARDSPEFMKLMDQFRFDLAQACDCHVVDLYAPEDWKLVAKYGASRWIAKQLEDGCRIVWIDTPQFRSRLNVEQSGYNIGDFRDLVVPYAVRLAIGPHLNATTQYTRHFVVRMEGFEVKDRHYDPLRNVVPITRFYLPKHTSDLYKELRESMHFAVE